MSQIANDICADLFRRIPVLRELRGAAQIDAEEAVRNTIQDVLEDYAGDSDLNFIDGDED